MRNTGMSRGAWMPIRTFSPMIASTETSMSSPIMMLWLDLRVSTNMGSASLLAWWLRKQTRPCQPRAAAGPAAASIP